MSKEVIKRPSVGAEFEAERNVAGLFVASDIDPNRPLVTRGKGVRIYQDQADAIEKLGVKPAEAIRAALDIWLKEILKAP